MGPKKKGGGSKAKQEKLKNLLLAKQEAEELRLQRLARLEEIKRLEDDAEERERLQEQEHNVRLAVLEGDFKLFDEKESEFIEYKINKRELEEWNQFVSCNKLPSPIKPQSMNTHLYLWTKFREFPSIEAALESVEKFIDLVTETEKLIDDPLNASERTVQNWKEVRQSYRKEILHKIDQGTFIILREVYTKMHRIDFLTVDYKCSSRNIKIYMWSWLPFPIDEDLEREPPIVESPQIGVSVKLPKPYDQEIVLTRLLHILFDPFSDSSKSWEEPSKPVEEPLLELIDHWHKKKIELDKYNWAQEAKELEKEKYRLTYMPEAKGTKTDAKKEAKKEAKGKKGKTKAILPDKTAEEEKKKEKVKPEEIVRPYIEREKRTFKMSDEHRQHYLSINGDLKEEQLMKIYCDIRDTVLDIMCCSTVEDGSFVNTARDLIDKGDPSKVKFGLLSLQLSDTSFREALFSYFRHVPIFFERFYDEVEEILPIAQLESREETLMPIFRARMEIITSPEEINLRKHSVLGGVYYLDLIELIHQKYPLEDGSYVQLHFGEHDITRHEFCFRYEPPKILETEDETEDEKPPPDDNIDKLIYVEITLPENIFWFEAPTPVLWDSDQKFWTTKHLYDAKFNEEKQRVCFRIERTLPIGLCVVRYNNLPFQTWDVRPGPAESNSVRISLTASTVIVELIIKDDKLALEGLQNAPNAALESILGKYFEPNDLINIMKRTGLDLFPEDDAFLYIEGNSYKDYVVEDMVYKGMAIFSPFFQFCWSRWNMMAGWDKLVYQVRQAYSRKQLPSYCMIMSDLFRSTIVECSEVSPSFTDASIPNIGFHPDLYSLLRNVSSEKIKPLIDDIDTKLIYTVYKILKRTKVLSYS